MDISQYREIKSKKKGNMSAFIYGTPKGSSRVVGRKSKRKVAGKKKN